MKRRVLRRPVSVSGIGIHTGKSTRATLVPAENVGTGVVFRLAANGQEIAATPSNVVETTRCTVLGQDGARISTVEHLLSALAARGVLDATVEVDGPELPIGDGGAGFWCDALVDAGLTDADRDDYGYLTLREPVVLTEPGGAFIAAYPAAAPRLTVAIQFDHPLVGTQVARFEPDRDDYAGQIAPARTFGFWEEIEALLAAGLALGGSLDNAVVVHRDRYEPPLRFENELARHKLLDLIGDLALVGCGIPIADIVAVRPSHRLNVAFARRLAEGRMERNRPRLEHG